MQPSPTIHSELSRCEELLENLKASKSIDEAEEHWKAFLSRLERVWYKCEAHFRRSPKWNGWKGKYERARKQDSLLVYLINARGAEEHTVEDIVNKQSGSFSIGPGPTGSALIQRLAFTQEGIKFDGKGSLAITFTPARLTLLPVTNRGRTYPVPTEHLGAPISAVNLLEIASAGLRFYKTVVAETESFLVDL
jgi:hypothetical protein